jgi:hypothetical protein
MPETRFRFGDRLGSHALSRGVGFISDLAIELQIVRPLASHDSAAEDCSGYWDIRLQLRLFLQ